MSTTETTTPIDEKKAEDSGTNTSSPDYKSFFVNYLTSITVTIGLTIFMLGGLGLYTTKVAQSNILPDNIELAPYTLVDRIVEDIPIDINIMRPSFFSDNKDSFSQKAIFNSQEYLDSFNKSFLCYLKSYADPNGGLFSNAPLYFSNVYDNLVAKNFLAMNSIFYYFSYLPESIIMILYGFFGIFIWMGLYFFNLCTSIFYHIINIPQLFRNASDKNKNLWQTQRDISFFNILKLILFFFLWIPIGFFSAIISPIFFIIYAFIAPLFATYKIKSSNKSHNVFDFIKDTFVYKKFFFFVLASLSLLSNGSKYLGNYAFVGIIIAIIIAYIMGLYRNDMPENGMDGFTSKIKMHLKQAPINEVSKTNPKLVKICKQIPEENEKLEDLIKNGSFRQLTKPKDLDADESSSNQNQNGGFKIKTPKKYNLRLV
jgi:hypothetical protein